MLWNYVLATCCRYFDAVLSRTLFNFVKDLEGCKYGVGFDRPIMFPHCFIVQTKLHSLILVILQSVVLLHTWYSMLFSTLCWCNSCVKNQPSILWFSCKFVRKVIATWACHEALSFSSYKTPKKKGSQEVLGPWDVWSPRVTIHYENKCSIRFLRLSFGTWWLLT